MAKKKHKDNANKQWPHVAEKVLTEAERLAEQIALNERTMHLLKKENAGYRIKLLDIMMAYRIPFINITLPIKKGIVEHYHVELVDKRGHLPVRITMKAFLRRALKRFITNKDERKEAANTIAKKLEPLLRIDSFLVTEMRKLSWTTKLMAEKITKAMVRVNEGHKNGN